MGEDLKIIKKKYGEKMMQLCRELFSTIIDKHPGLLAQILLNTFAPSRKLYVDIMEYDYEASFKNYIYSIYEKVKDKKIEPKVFVEDPKTLLRKVGYTLYECTTEEEIRKFRKYYAKGEELCTFRDNRLNKCYVYFAVKDGAEKLKRDDFKIPRRQDEYGTSVISIQFTRDLGHTLSIKNRYNHTVSNPDATFSNNLDNIVPGLTQSFADYYKLKQRYSKNGEFDLIGYVCADDGKYYKYNYEINNVYYCPGNIIIDNFKVCEYSHEKYLVADYFLFDFVNKKIINRTSDSFPITIGEIKKMEVRNIDGNKNVIIVPEEGNEIIITVDDDGKIIGYKNNNVTVIPNDFLIFNTKLKDIEMNNVIRIGKNFLPNNQVMKKISLPNVQIIDDNFMIHSCIEEIDLPHVKVLGKFFLAYNFNLVSLDLPEVITINQFCLMGNNTIRILNLPNLLELGDNSLNCLALLNVLNVPKVNKLPVNLQVLKSVLHSRH